MNYLNEYALIVAMATPVVLVVVMNLWLVAGGERDTLLLPLAGDYPTMAMVQQAQAAPAVSRPQPSREPANEERILEAA